MIEQEQPVLPHTWAGECIDSIQLNWDGMLISTWYFLWWGTLHVYWDVSLCAFCFLVLHSSLPQGWSIFNSTIYHRKIYIHPSSSHLSFNPPNFSPIINLTCPSRTWPLLLSFTTNPHPPTSTDPHPSHQLAHIHLYLNSISLSYQLSHSSISIYLNYHSHSPWPSYPCLVILSSCS